MVLADTSIWIEFLKARPPVFGIMKAAVEQGSVLGCEVVFGELLQGAKDERERAIIREYWQQIPKAAANEIWIEAGDYSSRNNLLRKGVGLIDAAILLSARHHSASVWTLDVRLDRLLAPEERCVAPGTSPNPLPTPSGRGRPKGG